MVKLALRPSSPFVSFPSIWEDEDWTSMMNTHGLDVYETDEEVVVKAPMPGIQPSNIDVTFEDGVLRITGRSEENEEEKKKKKVIYQSQRTTAFSYTTTLPRAIDSTKMTARVQDGIIMISAPLSVESKPQKIAVTTV
jgi:HSP20 family protein